MNRRFPRSLGLACSTLLSACGGSSVDGTPDRSTADRSGRAGASIAVDDSPQVLRGAIPEDPTTTAGAPVEAPDVPYWRLESDGRTYEGGLALYYTLEGDPMIQFVNRDAVNLALTFEGEMSGDRTVHDAMFVEGRAMPCGRVGELGDFRISFEPSVAGWLKGAFSGMLGCPDYSLMPVDGSFQIHAPGRSR